jgi:hypothetical protein
MADPTGNEPAAPVVKTTESVQRVTAKYRGFSKRERIAKDLTAALVSGSQAWPDDRDWPEIARRAVVGTKALLAELAKDGAQ